VIRPAVPEDAPGIAEIWNRIIRETIITFTTAEKDADTLAASIAEGMACHVAVEAGRIIGFVIAFQFRGGPGYAHTYRAFHPPPAGGAGARLRPGADGRGRG
jgi:L-amino acid N-acyltransferase YncA